MKFLIFCFLVLVISCVLISAKSLSGSENEESQAVELLRRITRQTSNTKAKSNGACKYQKGPWSACDQTTKKRTRTFSLKKGSKDCESVKILSKDCKGKKDKRQKQKNNKNRDRQRQNKKQEKSKNKQV